MPSFTTLYRAIVMIAAGVIVVKGWELYGPTAEQAKSFSARAYEAAQNAWNHVQPAERQSTAMNDDPRVAAELPAITIEPAPLLAAPNTEPAGVKQAAALEITPIAPAAGESGDPLPSLYSRLEELGAQDGQLTTWGSSGQMYRFACRASMTDAPGLARHFEAVAMEPVAAVEQVVAKLEAWRAGQ